MLIEFCGLQLIRTGFRVLYIELSRIVPLQIDLNHTVNMCVLDSIISITNNTIVV